ncbi:histidine ammonia-lyase [Rhodovulum sulfidophilum]|uniref:Histidine ammonia-lyase n=1 Tax=Rhodovulum sulfidophilum TaxID=35806 RepID=A0A0D6B4X5_RHOSU|nr:histidine ammonia-lyase [Rhodovulum sulfidophilum]
MRILRLPIIGPGRIGVGGGLKKRRDLVALGKLSPGCIRLEGLALNVCRASAQARRGRNRAEGCHRATTATATLSR